MADFRAADLAYKNPHFHAFGNVVKFEGTSPANAAAVISDRFIFARIPKGTEVIDGMLLHGAGPASSTLELGLEHVDGSVLDADFFFAATSIATTAGIIRKDNPVVPVILTKDAFVIGVLAGANFSADVALDVVVLGRTVGHG